MKDSIIPTRRILLHVCCAPCSCAIINILLEEDFLPVLFFYNPNIFPRKEYELRKASVLAYAAKLDLPFVDADYDNELWEERVKGLEQEPERGKRCSACFDMRLERAALYAYENSFSILATTNSIARLKNMNQVNASGVRAAARYPGMIFLDRNWRIGDALKKASQITLKENFYRQTYCGCRFSIPSLQKEKA